VLGFTVLILTADFWPCHFKRWANSSDGPGCTAGVSGARMNCRNSLVSPVAADS
jgi:hypothetical protein